MTELPFLVVHGAIVWKILLVVLVVATFAAVWALRRLAARHAARKVLSVHLGDVDKLADGPATVRGRLRGGSAASLTCREEIANHADGEPSLDHEGERIALAAPIRVALGRRAATSWWRAPRGTPGPLVTSWKRGASRLDVVGDGDEVVVTGVLARATAGDAGYRENATSWQLREPVARALAPAVRVRAWSPLAWIGVLALVAGSWYGVLHKIGSSAADRAQNSKARELTSFDAFAVAAAMPGSRDDALDALSWHLRNFPHTEAMHRLGLQLDELIGNCPAARLLTEVRLDEALASARACHDRNIEIAALLALGRYDEAAALPDDRPARSVIAAIGTGSWQAAANAAELVARDAETRERGAYYTDEDARARAAGVRCVGSWFAERAGDAAAWSRLRDTNSPVCSLIGAMSHHVQVTGDLLTARDYRLRGIARTLHLIEDDDPEYRDTYAAIDNLAFRFDPATWLVPFASPDQHAYLAALAAYRGDLPAAHAELARAIAANPAAGRRGSFELALALLEPGPFPASTPGEYIHPGIADMVALRRGDNYDESRVEGVYPESCRDDLRAGFVKASAGDGLPLAKVFENCQVYWIMVPKMLFGVLPRVTTHREELAAALRLFRNDMTTYRSDGPFRVLDDVTVYRDTARLIGDTADAAAWQAIVDRHARVLADRDRALGMLLWTSLL